MVCGLHIFLIVAGIYALVAGKLPLSQNKVAVGWPVRVAGVIFLLPLPVLMLIGFAIGFSSGLQNQPDPFAGREGTLLAVEISLQLICLAGGLALCFITARPPENVRPYRRRYHEDYDRPSQSRRPRDEDRDMDERRPRSARDAGTQGEPVMAEVVGIVPAERARTGPPPDRERDERRSRDEDEDEDRPRPARRRPPEPVSSGSSTLLIVLLLVGGFVLLLMVGGGILLWTLLEPGAPPVRVAQAPGPWADKKDVWDKKDFGFNDKIVDKVKDHKFLDKGFPKFEEKKGDAAEKKEPPKRPPFDPVLAKRIEPIKGGYEIKDRITEAAPLVYREGRGRPPARRVG
jgi:hypothetical protein